MGDVLGEVDYINVVNYVVVVEAKSFATLVFAIACLRVVVYGM